ncbi:hypothetical protein ABMA28_001438 [Loxostege sticticalis]|uniref:FLYWCH-type domain-containing protein n=1 Tax=Loxostege sticticalis TaxID=481309 RepID=A0ABD0T1P0_LOXSC
MVKVDLWRRLHIMQASINSISHEFQLMFELSQRGKPLLRYGGYTFCKKFEHNSRIRWVCSTHCCRGCYAYIRTIENTIITVKNEHNH